MRLEAADIPSSPVCTAAECAADRRFQHRGMVRELEDPMVGRVLHAGIVPHVPDDPGAGRWPGPPVGARTGEGLGELLGLDASKVEAPRGEGVL